MLWNVEAWQWKRAKEEEEERGMRGELRGALARKDATGEVVVVVVVVTHGE